MIELVRYTTEGGVIGVAHRTSWHLCGLLQVTKRIIMFFRYQPLDVHLTFFTSQNIKQISLPESDNLSPAFNLSYPTCPMYWRRIYAREKERMNWKKSSITTSRRTFYFSWRYKQTLCRGERKWIARTEIVASQKTCQPDKNCCSSQ